MSAAITSPTVDAGSEAPVVRRRSSRLLRSIRSRRIVMVALAIIALVVTWAIAAPLLAPHPPRQGNVVDSKLPPSWLPQGERKFLLGTDELGRDVLSRVIYGAQISLMVGASAVALAGAMGVSMGLLAGYYGGRLDDTIMRLADIQLALPQILLAIAILAVLGPGIQNVILTLAITNWVTYARVVRGQVLSLREREFVQAARCIGVGDRSIMFKHILPNTLASIIVIASFAVASTMLAEAALSFLGLSVGPDVPTWGGMVASGRDQIITGQWWIYTFPGLAIMLTVLGINTVGDWLRDYLDPRLRI
ncbi:MAG: ABC transporter permease [Chloroflexota bacterium]